MSKSMEDKLWFVTFLREFNNKHAIVYDLGCADGELIRHLAPEFPNCEFVGIDNSDDMLTIARQRQMFQNERYINNNQIYEEPSHDTPVILIMSSVFHEVVNYLDNPKEFLTNILEDLQVDYILFRDMIPMESLNGFSNQCDIYKIKDVFDPVKLEEFERYQGPIHIQRNLVHFLLKYRYAENWDREVRENYMPCDYKELLDFFPKFDVLYHKHYTLPYIYQIVKEDFGIELLKETHINVIFKRRV